MRGTLLLAAREVERRWALLAAALAAGLLPFAAPLLRGAGSPAAAEWRDAMAALLAVGIGIGAASLLGTSVLGRDLAEGRLGFDFTRPLGAPAIWAGRLVGALALSLGAMALTLLPTAVFGLGIASPAVRPLVVDAAPAVVAAVFLLVPLGHALSVMVRSRSAWLAVDGAAAVAIALTVAAAEHRLFAGFPWNVHLIVLGPLVPIAIAALWVATGVGLARGRTDLRRGHRALSLALWIPLAALALGFTGYVQWVRSASPGDLTTVSGYGATRGSWAMVYGESRGRGFYAPSFLVDLSSGRFERLGTMDTIEGWLAFSDDGRRAARLQRDADGREVRSLDLTTPGAEPRPTRIGFARSSVDLVLSEHGERLAALADGLLSVYELDSGRNLAAARLPGGSCSIAFVGADRVRAACLTPKLTIHELDVAAKRLETTGASDVQSGYAVWTAERDRLVVHETAGSGGLSLLDGRTGTLIAHLPPPDVHSIRTWSLLADGRIVVAASTPSGGGLRVYSRDGVEERTLELPGLPVGIVGGEVSRGRIAILAGHRGEAEDTPRQVVLVDLDSGETEVMGGGRWPWIGVAASGLFAAAPGSAATRLFQAGDALVALDPATGTWTPVAGR